MIRLKLWLTAILFSASLGGALVATAWPQTAAAACGDERPAGFPTWYRGLTKSGCQIMSPADAGGLSSFIWKIALNVVEMGLVAVVYLSIGFIIYGGFLYMTTTGQPDKIAGARRTILNAMIGLVLSFFSVVIVNIVVSRFSE